MTPGRRNAPTILFIGDLVVFVLSLWLTLLVRYLDVPDTETLATHFKAFAPLFVGWVLVFYMAGLYGKRVVLFKNRLFGALLTTQLLNIVLSALVFFFTPGIALSPKTNLVLYLLISLVLIVVWRLVLFPRVTKPVTREHAALIADGAEAHELAKEIASNPRYTMQFLVEEAPSVVAKDISAFRARLSEHNISLLVVDTEHEALRSVLPEFYDLAFVSAQYQVLDFSQLYEEVFDRVPLSLLQHDWFLKNVSTSTSFFYPVAKRFIDMIGGIAMGAVCALALPFVALAIRIEGKGPIFIVQERIGQYGARVRAYKFRTMRQNKATSSEWTKEEVGDNPVTRVGNFLRMTSLDEFPQFLNILKGEISLIGPRNDVEGLGKRLAEALPYYNMRYVVPPGITGWAQINQQYEQKNISPQSIEETKVRLAYDFYYIKHRSLVLDFVIALKTVKRMFFRVSNW